VTPRVQPQVLVCNTSIVTDVTWRCIPGVGRGEDWWGRAYDDSGWPPADIVGQTDVAGVSAAAYWVWAREGAGQGVDVGAWGGMGPQFGIQASAYCRLRLPDPLQP
jgi:hypothetical protein